MGLQKAVVDHHYPASLLSIPIEVLLHITSNLTTPEYGNFRLTCKQIETTLFPSFSREFFIKKQFMLTEFSLQALLNISKSRLSSCLGHVIIGMERPATNLSQFRDTHNIAADILLDVRARHNRMLQEFVSHMSLMNTGQDVEMLAEAFSNLSNLETIGMRDFNSHSRNRDYPNNQWRSYGTRTFLETGSFEEPYRFGPPLGDSQATYASRVFLNLLRALGKAGSRPKRFEVILRHTGRLYDHAFNIPEYFKSSIEPVLANLRTLFLDLNFACPPTHVLVDGVPAECPSYLLRKFLSKVHQLEHLRMNFQNFQEERTNDVLTWLSQPASNVSPSTSPAEELPEAPRPIYLANLRQLDIGMTTVEPKFLLSLLRKYRATLRNISFHRVTLLQPDSVKSEEKVNLWVAFFHQLLRLDLKLSAINLSSLAQCQMGKHKHIVFEDSRHPTSRSWAGSDVQSGLRDFINYTTVPGLEDESEDSNLSEEDNHEDASDDSMADVNSDGDGGDGNHAND